MLLFRVMHCYGPANIAGDQLKRPRKRSVGISGGRLLESWSATNLPQDWPLSVGTAAPQVRGEIQEATNSWGYRGSSAPADVDSGRPDFREVCSSRPQLERKQSFSGPSVTGTDSGSGSVCHPWTAGTLHQPFWPMRNCQATSL